MCSHIAPCPPKGRESPGRGKFALVFLWTYTVCTMLYVLGPGLGCWKVPDFTLGRPLLPSCEVGLVIGAGYVAPVTWISPPEFIRIGGAISGVVPLGVYGAVFYHMSTFL